MMTANKAAYLDQSLLFAEVIISSISSGGLEAIYLESMYSAAAFQESALCSPPRQLSKEGGGLFLVVELLG